MFYHEVQKITKERGTQEQFGYIMGLVKGCQMQNRRIGNDKVSDV